MHEIYRTIAMDLHRDRIRQADAWRLARQARRIERPTVAGRARGFLAGFFGQRPAAPAPAPASILATDSPACRP